MLEATATKHSTVNAMALKRPIGGKVPDQWKFWTWKEYRDDCMRFAKTLVHLGVDKYTVVNILGFNSVSHAQYRCGFAHLLLLHLLSSLQENP